MGHVWVESLLSEPAFAAALQDGSYFADSPEAALRDAQDFLSLVQQPWQTVVVCVEGYLKLQAAALDRQLPPELRAMNTVGLNGLPQPAQLVWQPCRNLLHPQRLLARELTGCTSTQTATQPLCCPVSQLEPVPFAVVEHCKLLEVQYVQKELYQQPYDVDVLQQAQQPAYEPAHMQQQQQAPQQPVHQQVWGAVEGTPAALQQPLCRRLSVRLVLQRLPAEPLPDEDPELGNADHSSWQHRGLQGSGDTQHVAYTCTLEYPAFTINSSDYVVPAALFYEGLRSWQALQKGEAFTMPWDGMPWRGFALAYRQRRPGDPFTGSPWWSIKVEWEDHNTDHKTDPEDFRFGNPWEMTREGGPPVLPDAQAALAAINLTGHPVLAAPWTAVWAAVEADASAHAKAKRKRQSHHHHDDDFIYEDGPAEDAAAVDAADLWDPTEDFYYDDDPEDFEVDLDEDVQPRRKSTRRQQQQSAGRRRSGSRRPSPAAADGTCCSRQHKAGAAAPGELTHNYGRELLARSDVCLVCGSAHGTLMSGHTGRAGGTCTRQYHAGCLLLLNAAGIRSVTLAKSAQQQQRKRGQASRASAPAAAAAANSLCDGLLGLLWHQSQLMDHQLSVAVVAAVAAAREAAARVAAGELVLICPSHGCHGCQLNGKLEFMVWCCCCWIRVYHHRQCVPYGAEHVKVDGRDFIRCPHCRAAGVPVPDSAAAAAAGRAGAVTADPAAAEGWSAAVADALAAAAAAAAAVDTTAGAGLAASRSAGQPTLAAAAGVGAASSSRNGAAAASEPHATAAAEGGGTGSSSAGEAAAAAMQTAVPQAPTPPSQQQQSSDTLQGVSDAEGSTAAARDGSVGPAGPAQPTGVPHEVVELLDSSEPGDPDQEDSGNEVILIDSSSEPEAEQACQQQQRRQQQMLALQADGSAPGAAADGGGGEEGDGDMLAMVASLDAQLAALQQQQQQVAPEQQQQEQWQQQHHVRSGSCGPARMTGPPPAAAAMAGEQGPAADGCMPMNPAASLDPLQQLAAAAELEQLAAAVEMQQLAAVVDMEQHMQAPSIPPWLQLALDDRERVSPSYILVPCASPDGASSSTGHSSSGADASTISVLAAAAAAGGTLPPPHAAAMGVFEGLPLSSPHSHWLIGCLAKAEAQYKPANVWGCAMIGVPLCPDDSLYGLAVVVDFLPALQQQQQQLAIPAAAAAGGNAAAVAARARPQVFLRCSKAVAANGQLQPAQQARGEEERRQGREWQVLVNGVAYPARQGRNGVALRLGDVVTVQGLSFKLQLAQ